MKKTLFVLFLAVAAVMAAEASPRHKSIRRQKRLAPETLRVQADQMAADNISGTLVASGHVHAVAHPICLLSELVTKKGDEYTFAEPTSLTTCTNSEDNLHWAITGEVTYRDKKNVIIKDMVLRAWGVPVMYFPYWNYPLDTDYGWRIMPGYSSRWGAYLLNKYVCNLAGGFGDGEWGLSSATRFDLRTKNGIALGESIRWQLGDFGRGKFKVYYAWDQDADTYDHHWTSRKRWHYENWGSKVPDERYALMLEHLWQASERDVVRLKGAYYSDSHFRSDFLRDGLFGTRNQFAGHEGNELAWEHNERFLGFGVSVAGPLNDFYGGVARLPEVYFDFAPIPILSSPFNYESSTVVGFYNRNYAKHGTRKTLEPFRYDPGRWADYQAFRLDTYHRITLPFKVADVLSVVPRVGYRGTYWSDSGYECLDGRARAGSTGSDVYRSIVEGGVTFAARAKGWIAEDMAHIFEPYLDFLAQEAYYSGLKNGHRTYIFDSRDTSRDWLDQFAGRSRNLPYSWYGFTPGIRNALRVADENGRERTLLDLDIYAAVQLNDTEWTEGGKYHRLVKNPEDPNYGENSPAIVPGVRARWFPDEDTALAARVEYDCENDAVAYADISWRQQWCQSFAYEVAFTSRDHRWWDFSSAPYDSEIVKDEDFNMARFSSLDVSFDHEICDALAWGPFVSWDCRESELDEVGAWFDIRTDCLGFRFSVAYENDYERIDYSRSEDDWRFGFFIYLRALGPEAGSVF